MDYIGNNPCLSVKNGNSDVAISVENNSKKISVGANHCFEEIVVSMSSCFKYIICGEKKEVDFPALVFFGSGDSYSFSVNNGNIIRIFLSVNTSRALFDFLGNAAEKLKSARFSPICKSDAFSVLEAANGNIGEIRLKQTIINLLCESAVFNYSPKTDIPEWLKNTIEKMKTDKNYTKGINRMVEISGKSQEHLSRSMRKYFKMTPTDFINSLRMENVSRLLRETDQPIVDICFDNGYQNISWFNTLFKEMYNMTPSQYRKVFRH